MEGVAPGLGAAEAGALPSEGAGPLPSPAASLPGTEWASPRVVSPSGYVFGAPGEETREAANQGEVSEGGPSGRVTGAEGDRAEGPDRPAPAPGYMGPLASPASPEQKGGEEGPAFYVPPEVDLPAGRKGALPETPEKEPPPSTEAIPPGDRTQAMGPVPDAGRVRVPQVICPECYARNPEGNRYCQECGNPLPAFSLGRPEARRPVAAGAARQPTAALPVQYGEEVPGEPYGGARREPEGTRPERRFGAADVVATTAALLLAAALALPLFLESFSYKKGTELGMFTHQGAYVRGAYELLGGPGLLPYRGTEFLTVGLVLALGLFLALLFLMVRTGRGPMYVLAGCLVVLPLAYLFFQAVLPLREKGVEIEPALGLGRLFFGGGGAPGLGPTVWMACAAAGLLILAGFLAPPRGWGRFFTFLTFFSLALGAGFLCAACYNWNLFISGTAAVTYGGMAFL